MPSRRIRAYLKVDTQFENAGDALILRELIRLLSARVPVEVYLGRAPDSFAKQLDVMSNPAAIGHRGGTVWNLLRDVIRARVGGACCYMFLTPGAPNGEKSSGEFLAGILRIVWLGALAMIGVRVCQVGVSFEHLGPRHARLLRWRSRVLYASVPRERIARDYAETLDIRVTGLMPDLSFNLFAKGAPNTGRDRRSIAFSFRVDKDSSTRALYAKVVEDLCSTANEFDDFVFIAQVGRDVDFMRELSETESRRRPGRVRFIDCHEDIEMALSVYGQCTAVLSNRLHVLLPCMNMGASPIALTVPELDPKITGVFASIGLDHRVFDIRSVGADDVKVRMAPFVFDGRAVAKQLNDFFDGLLGCGSY